MIRGKVDLSKMRGFERIRERVGMMPADMAMWADEYRLNHGNEWEAVKFGSGAVKFRGEVDWPAPVDQYTRKTDGATVPAWGGINKVHGAGSVKGRKRPSGQRVTKASTMMADTTRLSEFLTPAFERQGLRVVFDTDLEYGPVQNARRRFAFFADVDVVRLRDRIVRRLFGSTV